MKTTKNLQSRTGATYDVTRLTDLAKDTRLCTDLFGGPVPQSLTPTKAIAWADKGYRDTLRRLMNYREVFLENKALYEADTAIRENIVGLTE